VKVGDRVRVTANMFAGLHGRVTRGPESHWFGPVVNVALAPADLDARCGRAMPWTLDGDGLAEMTFGAGIVKVCS